MNAIPPLTMKLLWAALVSLGVSLLPQALLLQLMLWPLPGVEGLGGFMPWQFVTHLLVNPGSKLIFVGLTLYFFGGMMLEDRWSSRRYGLFLLACAIGSTLLQFLASTLAFSLGWAGYAPTFGADGVMYGILFACAYLWPNERVMLVIPPVPMKMQTLVLILCGLVFALGLWNDGIVAQFGFLGGLLAAWLHIRYWRGEPPFGKKKPKRPNLRVVH